MASATFGTQLAQPLVVRPGRIYCQVAGSAVVANRAHQITGVPSDVSYHEFGERGRNGCWVGSLPLGHSNCCVGEAERALAA